MLHVVTSTGSALVFVTHVRQALANRISAGVDAERAAVIPTERAVIQSCAQTVHRIDLALMRLAEQYTSRSRRSARVTSRWVLAVVLV